MGLIYADLSIANPSLENLSPVKARALADTGSMYLCIPEHISIQLHLKEFEKREVIPIKRQKPA